MNRIDKNGVLKEAAKNHKLSLSIFVQSRDRLNGKVSLY
jgi:hypothetical protein